MMTDKTFITQACSSSVMLVKLVAIHQDIHVFCYFLYFILDLKIKK